MRWVRRMVELSRADRVLLARALAWVLLMRVGLWLVPFARLRRATDRLRPTAASVQPSRIAWAVDAAGRRVPAATCLTRALAADALLRRSGRAPEIHLGVARSDDGIEAHAWLSLDGSVLIGDHELERYEPLRGSRI